jgi:hypothetical protein
VRSWPEGSTGRIRGLGNYSFVPLAQPLLHPSNAATSSPSTRRRSRLPSGGETSRPRSSG